MNCKINWIVNRKRLDGSTCPSYYTLCTACFDYILFFKIKTQLIELRPRLDSKINFTPYSSGNNVTHYMTTPRPTRKRTQYCRQARGIARELFACCHIIITYFAPLRVHNRNHNHILMLLDARVVLMDLRWSRVGVCVFVCRVSYLHSFPPSTPPTQMGDASREHLSILYTDITVYDTCCEYIYIYVHSSSLIKCCRAGANANANAHQNGRQTHTN